MKQISSPFTIKKSDNDDEQKALLESEKEKPIILTADLKPKPANYARVTRYWNVKIPPAQKTMVGGIMVPTFESTFAGLVRKEYRLSLEIHHVDNDSNVDPTVMKELLRRRESLKGTSTDEKDFQVLQEGEQIIVRVLRPIGGPTKSLDKSSKEANGVSDNIRSYSIRSSVDVFIYLRPPASPSLCR